MQRPHPEAILAGLGGSSSNSLDTNNSSLFRSRSRNFTDLAVCDVDHTASIFDYDPAEQERLDSNTPSSQADSDDIASAGHDALDHEESAASISEQILSPKTKGSSWYSVYNWTLEAHINDESEIGHLIQSQFMDTKPTKINLKYLAIVYDNSSLICAGQRIEHLLVTCYISAVSTSRGVYKSQMDSWLSTLQSGLVWNPINGGLYGYEPFMADCRGNGQRKLHTLLGEVPCNNKMIQQVISCFLYARPSRCVLKLLNNGRLRKVRLFLGTSEALAGELDKVTQNKNPLFSR